MEMKSKSKVSWGNDC